jgi:hypothetical protein
MRIGVREGGFILHEEMLGAFFAKGENKPRFCD